MNNLTEKLSSDRQENDRMLVQVPGLAAQTALQIGSAIFFPRAPTDLDQPYKTLQVQVDDHQLQFITCDTASPRSMYPVPAESFTFAGISHLFKHGGIPIEFKQCVLLLAQHRDDPDVLRLAFTKDEFLQLLAGSC